MWKAMAAYRPLGGAGGNLSSGSNSAFAAIRITQESANLDPSTTVIFPNN